MGSDKSEDVKSNMTNDDLGNIKNNTGEYNTNKSENPELDNNHYYADVEADSNNDNGAEIADKPELGSKAEIMRSIK